MNYEFYHDDVTITSFKYITRPAIHIWCENFDHGRESVVNEEEPGCHVVSMTDATIAAVDSHAVKPACGGINV